ncbi:ThiF family adenylyltransferase [Micromonospora sp. NPDC047730]|uniref:ThiF family adenylyltransferase n=1 Tax=Micromonospora sp. NPDC047730 TaxID=3364253 RepID=UPI0037246B73
MIKAVHQPYQLPGGRIVIGLLQYGVATEIEDDEQGSIAALLTLMDGTRDVETICADLARTHPDLTPDNVREVIQQLIDQGFVEDAGAPLPGGLTPEDAERYRSPRNFYAWIDLTPRESPYSVQERLSQARIVLLGLGGTGTAVAAGLVASGIGNLHCVDFDVIEGSNLTRQLLYDEKDIGRPKVEAAVDRLRAMNLQVVVTGEECQVGSADDVQRLMAGCDGFVLCADQPMPEIQHWVNEAAVRTGTPWFMSLYAGPTIVLGSFLPGQTGCYACLTRREEQREFHAAGRPLTDRPRPNAVVAAVANVGGQLCALEVIYYLAGLPQQTAGRLYHQNIAQWDHQYVIEAPRDAECAVCG